MRRWQIPECWSPWRQVADWRWHCNSTCHTWMTCAFDKGHRNHSHRDCRPPQRWEETRWWSSPSSISAFSLSVSVPVLPELIDEHSQALPLFASLYVGLIWLTASFGWPLTAKLAAHLCGLEALWSWPENCPMVATSLLQEAPLLEWSSCLAITRRKGREGERFRTN